MHLSVFGNKSLCILTPLLRNQELKEKLVRIDSLLFPDTNYCSIWRHRVPYFHMARIAWTRTLHADVMSNPQMHTYATILHRCKMVECADVGAVKCPSTAPHRRENFVAWRHTLMSRLSQSIKSTSEIYLKLSRVLHTCISYVFCSFENLHRSSNRLDGVVGYHVSLTH